ncbi:MAG: DUF4878 domain-containing protein [Prolixibacteraceae bacterium]|nr:DUF4878 domain-containing protein [Prolixibacteraceae bacterium]MBN2650053.1 DUF4878 domain-containing protein [Prolixibacteraceae bacterium]
MKKLFYLFSAITLVTLVISACEPKANTPSAAAEKVAKAMQKGDYKTVVNQMNFDEEEGVSSKDVDDQKEMFASLLEEKASESIAENGGIKSYEIIEETISEDGQTAEVKVKYTYHDNSVETETMSFSNINGDWLLEVSK